MRKIRSQRFDFSRLFSHAFASHLVWTVGLNLLLWAVQVSAGQVTLGWDAVNGASGYRLYYGLTSQSYTSQVNVVGQTTSPPVSITNGLTYFFAVKAYNSTGQESPFSNEVRVAPPVAAFNASSTSGTAPLVVTFTDQSTGTIATRSWNFGDNTSAMGTPVTHTYNTPGTYNVTLTVTGAGQTATTTKSITVTAPPVAPPPVAAFNASSTSGTAPLLVTFTDQSTGTIATRSWNFGDSTSAMGTSVTHTYNTAGTYSVTLTVTGAGQTATTAKSITVTASSVPSGTPGQVLTIEAEAMTLTRYSQETSSAASGGALISRVGWAGTPPGEATAVFPGPAGQYDITVQYFDENDGQSPLAVMVQKVLDTWVANAALSDGVPSVATRRSRVVATGFSLAPGDNITLEGSEQGSEYARFDKVDFVPVSSGTPGQVLTIEAEAMTLTRYSQETSSAASGGALISRVGWAGTPPGEATAVFPGPAGQYDITVQYFDENDGQSPLAVMVQKVLDTWVANAALSDGVPSVATRRSRVVATGFSLAPGDNITLEGSEQGGEYARFDKIDFVPVSSGPVAITGRVAAYALDETSGTTASEASSNGTNGVLTNGALFAAGKYGNGVSLDGVNDYVNLGNPASLRLTGSMTLSAWINSSTFPWDDAAIISRFQFPFKGYQLDTTIDSGPRTIGLKISDASGNLVARYGTTAMQTGRWYHVAGVYDATNRTMNVYLNGQLDNGVLVGTIPTAQPESNQNVNIGQRPDSPGTYNFAGTLDDVRIYNRALSAPEIQADMNTPLSLLGR